MKALQDVAAQEIEEEVYELPETEEATTTLGSLFANIKLSNHSAPSQFHLPNSYKSSLILFL